MRALALLAVLALAGCGRPAPPSPAAVAAQPGVTKDGLRLALTLAKTTFRKGEAIPVHAVLENVGAARPVAASLCFGFGVSDKALATGVAQWAQWSPPRCRGRLGEGATVALPVGKPAAYDFDVRQTKLDLPPGTYELMLSWQAYGLADPNQLFAPPVASVGSNMATVTITP